VIYGGSSEPLADGQSFPKSPRVGERTNNMKEKRFFPEKGLLMLSGAAFLLLIVPAWVPGFVWCGVAAVLLCAAVIAVFAMAGVCYAEDVGGIQRTIQLWCYGDQTDAVLEIQDGSYELTYEAADGVHSEGGGGVAIDAFGRERPLTEEELLEDLQNRIDVTYREDGTVWVYYKDQSMEITDLFDENGVCFVQLKDGKKTVYLTVEYDSCFSWSTECYLQPTQRHS